MKMQRFSDNICDLPGLPENRRSQQILALRRPQVTSDDCSSLLKSARSSYTEPAQTTPECPDRGRDGYGE